MQYGQNPSSAANEDAIVRGSHYRMTVLTERMVRLEYSPSGTFVDQQTQIVLNRKFALPEFRVKDTGNEIKVVTKYLIVTYTKDQPFSARTLNIQMIGNPYLKKSGTWFYGDTGLESLGNLKGTAVTLDNAVGDTYYKDSADEKNVWGKPDKKVELDEGLMSKNGFAVIDDSKSLIFDQNGWVHPSEAGREDFYFLCYGRDYYSTLDVFYHLTGRTPMLPRYALGNWWSRFYKYTQEEYLALLRRFRNENIPVSVGVLDMDWHHVDIDPKYGKGWTGYSWNRKLFPNPKAMMKEIHDAGMHFSLNVHPADGVRAHEDMYPEMAKALGIDSEHEEPIPFDVTDPKFMKAYFTYLHHPHESEGVDFWWVDWQQGSNSKVEGYDPLWMLNHYHYVDNARNGMRPMDFSRYAGLGSHRYPIGFSGSTFITWESLDYQPYFTANATNVGYGWWSHDIGGHRNGYRDDELTTRWVQFGVFSPIMRLHSSDEVFTGKEPWKFNMISEMVMRRFLTLRHQLIPYIYTMNHRFHEENKPLIVPLYYENPEIEEAYHHPNEYYFGSSLLVHPITAKSDEQTKTGSVKMFLPQGEWFDFFTGMRYSGNRTICMHREISTIPVLARAGAVIPMESEKTVSSRTDNPKDMMIKVFCGADGNFNLYEDDGISMAYEKQEYAITRYNLAWKEQKKFVISPAEGKMDLIPAKRNYRLEFYGVAEDALKEILLSGNKMQFTAQYDAARHVLSVEMAEVPVTETLSVEFKPDSEILSNAIEAYAYKAIERAQIPFATKEKLYQIMTGKQSLCEKMSTIDALYMAESMKSVAREIMTAVCR